MKVKRADAALAILLALLSLAWSGVAITQAPTLTRYDEWTYIDYARKVAQGHIPIRGEALADQTLEEWSCRGMEGNIRGVSVPPCGSRAQGKPHTSWPYKGENYNSFHPPVYFAVAGFGGSWIAKIFSVSFVTGARWISALFVAGGVVALFLAIRSWRASRQAAFAGALLALTTPAIASSAAIVHNDAFTLLAGAAAVWLSSRIFLHKRTGWVLPSVVIAMVVCVRTMSVAALVAVIGSVVAALCVPQVFGFTTKDRWRLGRLAVAGISATMVPYLLWSVWQDARTPQGYVPAIKGVSTTPVDKGSVKALLATIVDPYGLTSPRTDFYVQPELYSGALWIWSAVLYAVYLAVPVVAVIAWWKTRARKGLAFATISGPPVASLIVQVRELVTAGSYFRNVSGRYAISNVALHVGSLALLVDKPRLREGFVVFSLCGYIFILVSAFI